MHNFKQWIRAVIFVVVIGCLFAVCDYIFMPSGYIRVILNKLNDPEENYTCVVLGSSHGRSAINPFKLDEAINGKAMNMCIPGQTVQDSYYLLKESRRNNDINTVIMDLDYQYWYDGVGTGNTFHDVFIYNYLAMSKVKGEYIIDRLLDKDFRTIFARWAKYGTNFSSVASIIKTKNSEGYKNNDMDSIKVRDANGEYMGRGFFYRQISGRLGRGKLPYVEWCDNTCVSEEVVSYFNRIVDYCKENDIRLICIVSPVTPPITIGDNDYDKTSDYFSELCASKGVEYYDFNLLKYDILPRTAMDFGDWEGHMCGELAERYSAVMSEVINKATDKELDWSEYAYSSYKALEAATDVVTYVETDVCSKKLENGTYDISFNMDETIAGTYVEPKYDVRIQLMGSDGTKDKNIVHEKYSTRTDYSYNLEPGRYKITIKAKNKGSSKKYEDYIEKVITLQ